MCSIHVDKTSYNYVGKCFQLWSYSFNFSLHFENFIKYGLLTCMFLKFYFRLDEDQTTIAVANDEIQDLTAWLKETETLLCATPRTTDLNTAKTVLGKLKVSVNV